MGTGLIAVAVRRNSRRLPSPAMRMSTVPAPTSGIGFAPVRASMEPPWSPLPEFPVVAAVEFPVNVADFVVPEGDEELDVVVVVEELVAATLNPRSVS